MAKSRYRRAEQREPEVDASFSRIDSILGGNARWPRR
jgi:hypothetical protein